MSVLSYKGSFVKRQTTTSHGGGGQDRKPPLNLRAVIKWKRFRARLQEVESKWPPRKRRSANMSRNSKMTLWAESSALLRGARRGAEKKGQTVCQRLLRSVNQNALPSGGSHPARLRVFTFHYD